LIPAAREYAAKATIDVQATIAMRARQPMLAGYPIQAIGTVIEQYYTPKEKAAAAATMRGERGLAIARAAGLKDVEAAQLAAVSNGNSYYALVQLQKERLRFDELGQQLEAIAKVPARAGENADTMLREAARAYQSSGNGAAEMRVLSTLEARNSLDGELLSRYAILLVRQQAQAVAMAGNPLTSDSVRDALAKASIFAPKFTDTAAILAARGKGRPPVWTSAYTALAGVYLGAAKEPQVKQAFETVLGTQSIGDQLLARKANRNAQLTGKDWYYYAARYGQNIAGADDFAAADLESSPATASLYVQLGDVYSDRGDFTRAQSEYEYALQLNPKLPEAVRKFALTLYARGQKDQAIAAWRTALGSEYIELPGVIEDIVAAKSLDALKPDIDQAIRARFRRNGAYEAEALLRPLSQDFNWVLELANAAPGSLEVYSTLYEATWLTGAQRETVLAAVVAAADRSVQSSLGEARDMALQTAARWHAEQVRDWVNRREFAKASAAIQGMSADLISRQSLAFEEISIRMAASEGKFDGLNADSLSLETLERVASGLEPKNAAAVLEFAYGRELANHRYSAAVFLGMAKIRLQQGNTAEALTLLRRMNYTVGDPFSVTDLAGDLLLSQGKAAEAREFIDALAKAKPWDPKARVLQARVAGSAQGLKELAESGHIPYAIRCEAALAIRQIKGPALQSVVDELNLLSGQATVTEQQASASPYTFELRKLAASQTSDQNVKYRLQAGALAMRPSDLKTRRELFRAAIASRRFQAATNILNDGQAEGNDLALLTDAYLRIGRNHEAEAAARTMLDTGSPGARRLLELARNAAQLQSLNEQRMPIFQENYDQDRIVMPKLIAMPKRAVQGGSAQ
jgi:tetratricopeptide (TPR) repeat protein